jgi:hypothetical protein
MRNAVTPYNSGWKFGLNQVLITITYGMRSPTTFSPFSGYSFRDAVKRALRLISLECMAP